MVWNVVNVPAKGSGIEIQCTPTEHGTFRVHTSDGWEICMIGGAAPQGTANDIASAMRLIRDRGFEQGLQHVRRALGIKEGV